MAVRPGEAPKTLHTEVKFKNAHERLVFCVGFRNMRTSEYLELAESKTVGQLLVELVESWDAEYPLSVDGFVALEDEHPGTTSGLLTAYHRSRATELEGN